MRIIRFLFYSLSALFIALVALSGFALIVFFVYNSFPDAAGITIAVLLLLAGLVVAVWIFREVYHSGPLEFWANTPSTPEADHPKHGEGTDFFRYSPEEYSNLLKKADHKLKRGRLRIFGNWVFRNKSFEIISAEWDAVENTLTLHLSNSVRLSIRDAPHLYDADFYLKILHASAIEFRKNRNIKPPHYIQYYRYESKIKTRTNLKWYQHFMRTSLGEPALMIYRA